MRGDGPPSLSWAVAASAIVPPRTTSAGLALTPSMTGQRLMEPLTDTLPVVDVPWQSMCTFTVDVAEATTSNIPLPPQLVLPSVVVPISMIE